MLNNKKAGFTLIEVAIVLLIVSILLGYTVAMAPRQQELKQFKQAKTEMAEITDALYAFAQVNGYLPCPAEFNKVARTSESKGFECRDINGVTAMCEDGTNTVDLTEDTCDVWFGAVPGKTLGINGKYSKEGLLLDPWGNAYGYQVSDDDIDGAGTGLDDFVIQGEMRAEEMANLRPDLDVCNDETTVSNSACDNVSETVVANVPVIIWSTGKNIEPSTLQDENTDGTGTVYISRSFSDSFDDIVRWISPNILYSKMIEAGQLP